MGSSRSRAAAAPRTSAGTTKAYRLDRVSLTERQLVEFEIDVESGKVMHEIRHEPDIGRIVISKFLDLLASGG